MIPQTLLYDDIEEIPYKFEKEDIRKMVKTIENSKNYLPNIWGEWMRARDKCLLLIIYSYGLRPKEGCSLMFRDINLKQQTIHIRGETNKQKKGRLSPLTTYVIKYFREFLSNFPRYLWKGSEHLFPSFSNKHLSAERWKHIFREKVLKPSGLYREKIGNKMPESRTYTLRVTRAVEMLEETEDPWAVAEFLGHSDLRSLKRYLFLTKQMKQKQATQLENLGDVMEEKLGEVRIRG